MTSFLSSCVLSSCVTFVGVSSMSDHFIWRSWRLILRQPHDMAMFQWDQWLAEALNLLLFLGKRTYYTAARFQNVIFDPRTFSFYDIKLVAKKYRTDWNGYFWNKRMISGSSKCLPWPTDLFVSCWLKLKILQ